MLPGVGRGPPPGRGPPAPGPGRGPPGPGAPIGRGIGRSTGCCEEKGLLPTRGGRGAAGLGPGRGPGASGAAGGAAGAGAAATGAAGCAGAGGFGAAGLGPGAGAGAPATGAAAGALGAGLAACGAGAAALAGAFSAAGLFPPNDSRRRRATGASTVDDADFTNSPCSLSRARTSLLVTPSSLANSCTRALPAATDISISRGDSGRRRASGLAMTHGHRDFTVCSCSSLPNLVLPVARRATASARRPRWCPVNR